MKDAIFGPIRMSMAVHFRAGDRSGSANFEFTFGKIPGQAEVLRAIGRSIATINDQLGGGAELMPPDEFLNEVVLPEIQGVRGNFAVPGYMNYDVAALELAAAEAAKNESPEDED